jgi:hypothetical protein
LGGDKRSQIVHDLQRTTDDCALEDLVRAETYLVFAPDRWPEARNRDCHACRHCQTPEYE